RPRTWQWQSSWSPASGLRLSGLRRPAATVRLPARQHRSGNEISSLLGLVKNFLVKTIEFAIGTLYVNTGQHDGHKDHTDTQRNSPGSDAACGKRNAQDFRLKCDGQDEGQISAKHQARQQPGRATALCNQLLEPRIVVELLVQGFIVHCVFSARSSPSNEGRGATLGPLQMSATRL